MKDAVCLENEGELIVVINVRGHAEPISVNWGSLQISPPLVCVLLRCTVYFHCSALCSPDWKK